MMSPEVSQAVDEIRRNKSLTQSLMDANKLLSQKISDLQSKVDAIPAEQHLSQEDKDALAAEVADLDALNDQLEGATKANTTDSSGSSSTAPGVVKPVGEDGAPTEPLTSGDTLSANGPANHPAGGSSPLMPTAAFDPDPNGMRGAGGDGQPNQPKAIETPGGFVTAGGGATARAPGSMPDSPSSTLSVPTDPDTKAPVNNADLVKSGLGDSSKNATIDADGKSVTDMAAGQIAAAPKTDEDAMDAPAQQRPVLIPNVAETDAERTAKSDAANPEGSRVSDADRAANDVPPARGGPNG
jgi:hypothetical protein